MDGRLELWDGAVELIDGAPTLDREERAIENAWGLGRYDARMHPIYAAFKQHLDGHECWKLLSRLEVKVGEYRDASQRGYEAIRRRVRSELPDAADEDVLAMSSSLVSYGYQKLTTPKGAIEFSYQPMCRHEAGETLWYLRLGSWATTGVHEPDQLRVLADVHRRLADKVVRLKSTEDVAKASKSAGDAIRAYKESLTPDTALRRLVLTGRCDHC